MATSITNQTTIWACIICTYENQNSHKLCEMCGSCKPSAKGVDDQGWKCILCTYANASNSNACGVCGAPSPLTNDLTGKQLCASCTAINYANAQTCIVCAQPLSNKIIQMNANGQLQQMDVDTQPPTNPNISTNNNTDTYTDNTPAQFANPFSNPNIYTNDNVFNGFNNYQQFNYAPQQQHPQYQQQFGMNGWLDSNDDNYSSNKHKHKSHRHSSKHKHKHTYNQDNNDNKTEFKDVTEIFKKDANDTERLEKEKDEVKVLSEWYSHIYLSKKHQYSGNRIHDIINKMIEFIPNEHWDEVETNKNKYKTDSNATLCQVCYCEFDQDEGRLIAMRKHCDHAMICKSCFEQNLKIKIKDDDITPWIQCVAPDCKAPICCELLLQHLDLKHLYKFAEGFIRKHLARNGNWIRCGTKDCNYGWMILDTNTTKQHKVRCDSCNKRQTVCKDPIQSDKGFSELIKSGVLRVCPKCSLPTMKDKGMCNVMHCGKCGIFWNWRTRETGTSSSQLKNKSRMNGTLWEPGELSYQQKLQKGNLPEFIKLLERNGIKYDPNYVRGR